MYSVCFRALCLFYLSRVRSVLQATRKRVLKLLPIKCGSPICIHSLAHWPEEFIYCFPSLLHSVT